ncbi:hypothetical protein NL676_001441 [Syzygium grande]|nr:hypothetical protein NL676_001441 [Syzygium grande]
MHWPSTPQTVVASAQQKVWKRKLLALAANKDLSFNYTPKPVPAMEQEEAVAEPVVSPGHSDLPLPVSLPLPSSTSSDQKPFVNTAR